MKISKESMDFFAQFSAILLFPLAEINNENRIKKGTSVTRTKIAIFQVIAIKAKNNPARMEFFNSFFPKVGVFIALK